MNPPWSTTHVSTHSEHEIATASLGSSRLGDQTLSLQAAGQRELPPTVPPSATLEDLSTSPSVRLLLHNFGLEKIPAHPALVPFQRGGSIKVNLKMLQCDTSQMDSIQVVYSQETQFHKLFSAVDSSQHEAHQILGDQGLDLGHLEYLGNRWSKRWSIKTGRKQRSLLQCQSGSSTVARKQKEDAQRSAKGLSTNDRDWARKMQFDFTGCLAHMDVTYSPEDLSIYRITGILTHDEACQKQLEAIRSQLEAHVEHELTMILPRLHGLAALLEQSEGKLPVTPHLRELEDLMTRIQQTRSLESGVPAQTVQVRVPRFPAQEHTAEEHRVNRVDKRRLVLPPPPERGHKRHRSHEFH